MKVGNIVNGLAVVDVKRVNKMNLIQFTKAVSEYIEQGYKLDVNSSRQIGLVLQVDLYKLESNVSVGSTEIKADQETKKPVDETEYLISSETNKKRLLESVERIKDNVNNGAVGDSITDDTKAFVSEPEVAESVRSTEDGVKQPNETTIEAMQESTSNLETVETIDDVIEEALADLKESDKEAKEDVEDEQTTPPVKKSTRAKKTT